MIGTLMDDVERLFVEKFDFEHRDDSEVKESSCSFCTNRIPPKGTKLVVFSFDLSFSNRALLIEALIQAVKQVVFENQDFFH